MGETTITEYRGVRRLMAAKLIEDNSEGMKFDTPFAVAGVAEISRTTSADSATHYYDNAAAIVIDSTGKDEVKVTISALPFDILADLTGQSYDDETGMFVEGERKSEYFALGYVTEKTDGTEIFVWRLKGKFGIPDSTHKTKDEGTDASGQELTFTGINTVHKFDIKGEKKTVKAINVNVKKNPIKEEDFFAAVQTPETVKAGSVTATAAAVTEEQRTPEA